ncbi:hypothetical protein, partial [Mesorhizobium sp. 98Argb]
LPALVLIDFALSKSKPGGQPPGFFVEKPFGSREPQVVIARLAGSQIKKGSGSRQLFARAA